MAGLKTGVIAALLLAALQAHSAKGTFYAGVDGLRSLWHVKQKLVFNNNVSAPLSLNGHYHESRQRYNGDIVLGIKGWNGSLFAALEGWYNADVFRIKEIDSPNISYRTRIGQRGGGRLRLGLQERNCFLFAVAGLSVLPLRTQTTYPTGSIYRSANVNLSNNNFASKASSTTWGFGLSSTLENNINVGFEYQHQRATNRTPMSNTNAGATNPAGIQHANVSADTYVITLAYQFLPFVF